MRGLYPDRTGIWSVGLWITRELGEKPLEQGEEPTTNSTHLWHLAGINPGLHCLQASQRRS